MMPSLPRGVYVALLTPRSPVGTLDLPAYEQQMRFAAECGVQGFAVNGATGEFPATTPDELQSLLNVAARFQPTCKILSCIGSANLSGAIQRARIAEAGGADAVLLPMPYFFPYRQDDLLAFCSAVAEKTSLPILLYNLPQFTTGLAIETALALMRRHSNIVGLKDSSGSLDLINAMAEHQPERVRLMGNDAGLCDAIRAGVCDGVVSGVACVLPELMSEFFRLDPGSAAFGNAESLLLDFIEQIKSLPTPWGLKAASALRGIVAQEYALPLSLERVAEIEALSTWMQSSFPALNRPCDPVRR